MQNVKAIITDRKGKVLSIGKNSYLKTHPLQAYFAKKAKLDKKIFLHAEIDAISKCKALDKAYKIVVSRRRKDGSFGISKPCPICYMAIYNTNIQEISYTK